jgi:hypothetical protein
LQLGYRTKYSPQFFKMFGGSYFTTDSTCFPSLTPLCSLIATVKCNQHSTQCNLIPCRSQFAHPCGGAHDGVGIGATEVRLICVLSMKYVICAVSTRRLLTLSHIFSISDTSVSNKSKKASLREAKTPTKSPSRARTPEAGGKPSLTARPSKAGRGKAPSKATTAKPYEMKTRDCPTKATNQTTNLRGDRRVKRLLKRKGKTLSGQPSTAQHPTTIPSLPTTQNRTLPTVFMLIRELECP